MSETIWFLKQCDWLGQLTPEEIQTLERAASIRKFGKREVIYFPNQPGQTVLLLIAGRVKLKDITPDGKETILAFIEEGELFGELALFNGAERREFAECVERSQVMAIECEAFTHVMELRPQLALHITKLVGLRRQRVENRLRNILFRSNRERLAHVLLELLETHGQESNDGWQLKLKLSHQDFASLIGSTRESVTLALGQLQLERLIQVKRRQVVIVDPAGLKAAAAGEPNEQLKAKKTKPARKAEENVS